MPILVNLPDGSQASFPDGTSQEVMTAAIRKKFPPQPDAALNEKLAHPFGRNPAPAPERAEPNQQASQLPGIVGQFQNTSNAIQSGFNQGLTLGFGDELYAGVTAPFRAIPGALNGEGYDLGKAYEAGLETQRTTQEQQAALNPIAAGVGEVTGAVVNPASRLLMPVKGAGVAANALRGAGGGAATGGVYGFGSAEGDIGERARGGLVGAATGAGVGVVAPWLAKKGGDALEGVLQSRATSQAVKNAPVADDLATMASDLFKSSKSSGIGVQPNVFGTMARNLAKKAHDADIDRDLDGAAYTVYERMIEMARAGFNDPSALTLSRLHNLRQKAQDVVMDTASKGRTKTFANQLIDSLDEMIGKLKPADLTIPPGRIGGSASAASDLLDGISTWSKAKKVGVIEAAIAKAQNYPSGVESGLRNQFRSLLNNKATAKMFTNAEQQALRAVVNGTAPVNALRSLGMFKGVSGALLGNMFGGPLGAAVGWAAGVGGKKITEKATEAAAQRAARVVATPNVPSVTVRNPLLQLPPGPLALPLIDQMRANLGQ